MTGKYSLIYADPPWSYGNTISNGAAADHYSTMKLIDIKRLPVWELAADPDDLSEWADMQFLLWDAQRRAGITDEQITAALEEKLKVNMARQWPEPKDGEPRLHIKP